MCRQAVLALNPLQIVTFRGHCVKAGPRMRQPLHVPLSLQLKGIAVPGTLLSLCLGASPTEDQQAPPQGLCQSPGLQGVCQEVAQRKTLPTGWGRTLARTQVFILEPRRL